MSAADKLAAAAGGSESGTLCLHCPSINPDYEVPDSPAECDRNSPKL